MAFQFGQRSKEKLETLHPDLQKTLLMAISVSQVDFGIAEGHRSVEKQQEYYAIGRTTQLDKSPITNIDGVTKKGKHNYKPSLAVDIFVWHDNQSMRRKIAYDPVHLGYLAGVILTCAEFLKKKGEITNTIRWGNNWDMDGVIAYDQNLDDAPHFEII